MASLLDPFSQPVDQTQAIGTARTQAELEDMRQRRLQQQAATEQATDTVANARAGRTASNEMAQWAVDPTTKGKGWNELDPYSQGELLRKYPTVPDIPGLYNQQQSTAAGHFVGVQTQPGETVTGKLGDVQKTEGKPEQFKYFTDPNTGEMVRYDPITGESKIISPHTQQTAPQTDELGQPVHGEAALKGLAPNEASVAKQLASYQIPLTALSRMPAPQRLRVLAATQAYDPTFDASQYQARQALARDFQGGGKTFQNITAANTVIGHLKDLNDAMQGLDNFHSGTPGAKPLNWVKNQIASANGSPEITRVEQVKQAVAAELAKTFQGGAPHTAEVEAARNALSAANTPEQTQAAVQAALHLVGSRLGELHDQYMQTMGKWKETNWLNPRSAAIIRQLGVDPAEIEPSRVPNPGAPAAQPATGAQPQGIPTVNSQAEYDALPKGTQYRDSQGKTATKR